MGDQKDGVFRLRTRESGRKDKGEDSGEAKCGGHENEYTCASDSAAIGRFRCP